MNDKEYKEVYDKVHKGAIGNSKIFEYIRRRKGGKAYKVGVIIGTNDNGTIRIGWSKCNFKSGDRFRPVDGYNIAHLRMLDRYEGGKVTVPLCIKTQVRRFGARCVRYFKDAKKLELPV